MNFAQKIVVLYTRKTRNGALVPRKISMTSKAFEILSRRYEKRPRNVPWVFWHRNYFDPATGKHEIRPFGYRDSIMRTLCKRAGVRHFTFHAFRHSGASIMDQNGVPISSIQRILGHANRSTTEIYLHSLDYAERDAMATYDRSKNGADDAMDVFERVRAKPHTNHTPSGVEAVISQEKRSPHFGVTH